MPAAWRSATSETSSGRTPRAEAAVPKPGVEVLARQSLTISSSVKKLSVSRHLFLFGTSKR